VSFAVVVGYYLVSLFQVWQRGRQHQAREVDVIVVLGAAQYDGRPSPQLAPASITVWRSGGRGTPR
jgi:hypothetical protein